jgi:SAM-dependent methyltransferase
MATEFNREQFSQAYSDGIEGSYWNIARKKIIRRYIRKHKLNSILDVGCGRGIVTSYLHKAGLQITGADLGAPSPADLGSLKIYYNTDALELPEDFRNTINTITLFDVIEHVENPVSFIKSLSLKYPNLKNLVITVPARKELWTNFDDYYGHFRRYTLQTLSKEIEDSGFEITFSRYFFHILYILIRLNNLLVKQRDINFKPPKGLLSNLVNKIMGTKFYFETFVVPGNVLGSSIICICKKK